MKKAFASLILAAIFISSLAACQTQQATKTDTSVSVSTVESTVSQTSVEGSTASQVSVEPNTVSPSSAENTLLLGQKTDPAEKYTLYLGLNDKDTYEQLISTEEALNKANQICAKYAGGYTQLSANGGWTNDDGTMGYENTIVYLLYDISEENLKGMLNEFIKTFNQSSVLVEKETTAHLYYSGE